MVEITLTSKLSKQSYFTLSNILKYAPVIGVFIVCVALYGMLTLNKRSLDQKISETNQVFSRNEAIIKKDLGSDSYRLAGKTESLAQVLSQRLYWSNMVGKFDNIFNADTKVTETIFDMEKFKITVTATAPNYGAIEKQISDLRKKKDIIQSVSLDSPSFSDNNISFRLEITLKNDILKGPYL